MSGLRHGWGKFDDNGHADFKHGAVPIEDFEEEARHVKKSKKGCKKSKTKEPCDFTVAINHHVWYSKYTERWQWWKIMTCERCGKHGPWTSMSSPRQPN